MVPFGPFWLKRGRRNAVGSINVWETVWGNCMASLKILWVIVGIMGFCMGRIYLLLVLVT